MIVSLIALLGIGGQAVAPPAAEPWVGAYVRSLEGCGVSMSGVRISWNAELQGVLIVIDDPALSDARIDCIANTPALDSSVIDFARPGAEGRYWAIHQARPDVQQRLAEFKAEQRRWLDERGLLRGLPVFTRGDRLTAFASAVEVHCGVAPGSILIADEARMTITFRPGVDPGPDRFSCLTNALSVSDLEIAGVSWFLTGVIAEP